MNIIKYCTLAAPPGRESIYNFAPSIGSDGLLVLTSLLRSEKEYSHWQHKLLSNIKLNQGAI